MYRHSPVRNQRSKGIKIKHVLQICLLVAVCFWLIFQVKRSHDKKKEFNATDTKISLNTRSSDEVAKFGRKDLRPKLEETTKEIEKHEEEDEAAEEEDEHEEEDKIEEEKDDEIDENELEKSDTEVDQDDDSTLDEDKEREESDENENDETDGQSQSQTENESSSEVLDQDGVIRNTHEAREEHYKADDASSAVTHENRTLDNSIENLEMGISEHENQVDNGQDSTTDVKEKDVEKAENGASSNTTRIQETGSENGPPSNATSASTQATNITEGATVLNSSIAASDDGTRNMEEKSSNSTNVSEVVDFSKSTTEENSAGPSQTEGDKVTERTQETLDSSETKSGQKVVHETIDSSDLEDGNRGDTAVE